MAGGGQQLSGFWGRPTGRKTSAFSLGQGWPRLKRLVCGFQPTPRGLTLLAIVARGVVQFGCAYGKALSAGNRRRLKTTTASNNQNSAVLVTGGQPVGRTKAQVHVSEQSVIVWDLETVPDLAAAARLFDMGRRQRRGGARGGRLGLPLAPASQDSCIGALVASRQPGLARRCAGEHPTLGSDQRLS